MEAIITVVGFLGAGKTTLLKHLTTRFIDTGWSPYVILNDYENAFMDAQQFQQWLEKKYVKPLSGSCICCSGVNQLREFINRVPERANGVTLIEANGTSDSCSLMGFLGVGVKERFLPPVQVSVVDVKNWQQRGEHNELEANQIQVSSLIVLTHLDDTSEDRQSSVLADIKRLNPSADIINMQDIDVALLPILSPSTNEAQQLDHLKAHWSSCSADLPNLPDIECITDILKLLPDSLLRIKGCTQIGAEEQYTFFERTPDGEVTIRPFFGEPVTGPKLLTVGLGSEVALLEKAIETSLIAAASRETKGSVNFGN